MNSSDKQPVKFSITDMSLEDRPREKFESLGPDVLSVSELLAILIGSGSAKENAVQLMQRVMKD
ncbi:DNA repair protein radc, partial [gut metagenome]